MGVRFQRNSVTAALSLTMGIIVLFATAAVSLAGYLSARSTIERQIDARLGGVSSQSAAVIDGYFEARVEEIRQMVFSRLQIASLSSADRLATLTAYAGAFGSTRYADLTILNMHGGVVASTGSPQFSRRRALLATLGHAMRPGIVDMTRFEDQSQATFVVYAPLIDENGRRNGTLVGRLLPTELVQLFRGIPLDAHTALFLVHGGTVVAENRGATAPNYADRGRAIVAALDDTQTHGFAFRTVAAADASAALAPVRVLAMRSAIVGLIVVLVALAAAFLSAGRIARPLHRIGQTARRFADGNLDARIEFRANELVELRELAAAFNFVAATLSDVLEGIAGTSRSITTAAGVSLETVLAVRAATEQQAASSAEITAALDQAAAGAHAIGADCNGLALRSRGALAELTKLVGAVEATDAAVGELRATIEGASSVGHELARDADTVASHARDVGSRAEAATRSAHAGRDAVHGLVGDIGDVGAALTDTVDRVEHLADATVDAIRQQIALIGDLAERSKLLALNAAIEAGRAGETGRAFSVIASELQGLADGSKSAGDEVSHLLDSVIAQMQTIVDQAQDARGRARVAVGRANETGSVIDGVVVQIAENSRFASEIRAVAAEQAERTAHLETATEAMRRMAATTADASRTVAELSRRLRGTIDHASDVAAAVAAATQQQIDTFAIIGRSAGEIGSAVELTAAAAEDSSVATVRLRDEIDRLSRAVGTFAPHAPASTRESRVAALDHELSLSAS